MEQFLPSKLMNIYIANVIPMHSFEFASWSSDFHCLLLGYLLCFRHFDGEIECCSCYSYLK